MTARVAFGLDFGTGSVRAMLIELRRHEADSAIAKYSHGQITETRPGSNAKLPHAMPCSIRKTGSTRQQRSRHSTSTVHLCGDVRLAG